jgi:hypothetical protein
MSDPNFLGRQKNRRVKYQVSKKKQEIDMPLSFVKRFSEGKANAHLSIFNLQKSFLKKPEKSVVFFIRTQKLTVSGSKTQRL